MQEPKKIKQYPKAVRIVVGKLLEAGYDAYLVGGCVRDALLGREPHDWDVTTSASPEETLACFSAFRTVPTGIKHGTVTVLVDSLPVEVTTFRVDGTYSDSRRPDSVTFTRNIREDLSRRDFTVNAMAYNERDGFVDLYGGRADLDAKCIRAVGDPVLRFSEDALRILRAVRFSVQLQFAIDAATYAALSACRAGLGKISAERIREEFIKILMCPDAVRGVEMLFDAGLDEYVLPGYRVSVGKMPNFAVLEVLPPEPEVRLAYLLRRTDSETAERILRFLKPSNAFADAVRALCTCRLPARSEPADARRFFAAHGDLSEFALNLLAAESGEWGAVETAETLWVEIADAKSLGDCMKKSDLAVTGRDLMEAGVPSSVTLGSLLDRLFDAVLEDPERNEKSTLTALALQWYREGEHAK